MYVYKDDTRDQTRGHLELPRSHNGHISAFILDRSRHRLKTMSVLPPHLLPRLLVATSITSQSLEDRTATFPYRGVNDESKLRRFYLNWGLKEAYVKAVGQGLGYDLRRVSFVEGDWLDCSSSVKDFADASGRRTCRCPRKALKSFDMASNRELRHGVPCDFKSESEEYRAESGDHEEVLEALLWKQEDVVGCTCGLGTAAVKVRKFTRPFTLHYEFAWHVSHAKAFDFYISIRRLSNDRARIYVDTRIRPSGRRHSASRLVVPSVYPTRSLRCLRGEGSAVRMLFRRASSRGHFRP